MNYDKFFRYFIYTAIMLYIVFAALYLIVHYLF
nr:MAG TPA: hypothetical protein [Microviridae sp.]